MFQLRKYHWESQGDVPGCQVWKSTLTKNFKNEFFVSRFELMSDLKSEKISPTRPPMAYPKMKKKNWGGGFLDWGGIFDQAKWDFASPWFQMIQTFFFFNLKFNKMHMILKLSEKIFNLGLVGISCIFSLNSWVKRFNGTIRYTVGPTLRKSCCTLLFKSHKTKQNFYVT